MQRARIQIVPVCMCTSESSADASGEEFAKVMKITKRERKGAVLKGESVEVLDTDFFLLFTSSNTRAKLKKNPNTLAQPERAPLPSDTTLALFLPTLPSEWRSSVEVFLILLEFNRKNFYF